MEATCETMPRKAVIADSSCCTKAGIVADAAHLLDLERQVADRVLETGEAFGRLQFAQRLVHVGQPALHIADDRRIDAVLAALVEPPGDLAHLVFQRFDRVLRHRFIELAGNLGELLAERGDLFVLFRLMQPLDHFGDIAQLAFEAGQILLPENAAAPAAAA